MAASAAAEDLGDWENKCTPTPEPLVMASTTTASPNEALKIFIPSPYDGTSPCDADQFIAQCTMWFKKAKITDKDSKVGEALFLMEGQVIAPF